MAFLELHGCTKNYGSSMAVSDVSLAVQQGERFGLLGPSGSGKTTLLRLIAGLEKLHAGKVVLEEKTIYDSAIKPAFGDFGIAMIFQSLGLWPHLSAADHLDLVLRKRVARKERPREIMDLLAVTRLADKAANRPGELSGGEQQRLALARALAQRPKLLLMDEPFSHVDEPLRDELCDSLLQILEQFKITAIVVSHDAPHLAALCHRIGLMQPGRMIQQGTFRELYDGPQSIDGAKMTGPAFFLHARSQGNQAQTDLGLIPLRQNAPTGEGLICLRPEDFQIGELDTHTNFQPSLVIQSVFIQGRWRTYFRLGQNEFWTWELHEREAGARVSVKILSATFIQEKEGR